MPRYAIAVASRCPVYSLAGISILSSEANVYIVSGMPNISVNNDIMNASVNPYEVQSIFFGLARKTVYMNVASIIDAITAPQFPYQFDS